VVGTPPNASKALPKTGGPLSHVVTAHAFRMISSVCVARFAPRAHKGCYCAASARSSSISWHSTCGHFLFGHGRDCAHKTARRKPGDFFLSRVLKPAEGMAASRHELIERWFCIRDVVGPAQELSPISERARRIEIPFKGGQEFVDKDRQ